MFTLNIILYPFIVLFLFIFINSSNANKKQNDSIEFEENNNFKTNNIIKILMKKPDYNDTNYLEIYTNKINSSFRKTNPTSDLYFKFDYCDKIPFIPWHKKMLKRFRINFKYIEYLSCIVNNLKRSDYDLLIIDNNILFSDISLIRNLIISYFLEFRDLCQFYTEIPTSNVKSDYFSIDHHDKTILQHGYYDNKLYGLPYEIDFDLFYYNTKFNNMTFDFHSNNNNNNNNNNITWNSMLPDRSREQYKEEDELIKDELYPSNDDAPLSLALDDYNEFLKYFIEYICYFYDIPSKENKRYFNDALSKNSTIKNILKSFNHYTKIMTGSNVNSTLETGYAKAYSQFIQQEKQIFKGKASDYININNIDKDKYIYTVLPPKNYTVINEKFIVINKNSKKNTDLLIDAAYILTSPYIQEFKSVTFGSIPTYNITKRVENTDINNFCKNNEKICDLITSKKSIPEEALFKKDHFSTSFLESKLYFPYILKQFLQNNDTNLVIDAITNILETKYIPADTNIYKFLLYISEAFFNIGLLLTIITVHQNREHPYLKAISPRLCNIVITGLILNNLTLPFITSLTYHLECRVFLVYVTVNINLIFLPMLAITFRIYYIFTSNSNSNIGKRLNDRHLIFYMAMITFLEASIALYIAINDDFYFATIGLLYTNRIYICFHSTFFYCFGFIMLYILIVVISVFILIKKTGKISKKYDEIKFIYTIVIHLAEGIIFGAILLCLPKENFTVYFLLVCTIYLFFSCYCVYLLVGRRLMYIIEHPMKQEESINKYNVLNIADFVPVRSNKKNHYSHSHSHSLSIFSKNRSMYHDPNQEDTLSMISEYRHDTISNNPNNYFFIQTLKRLNNQSIKNSSYVEEEENNTKNSFNNVNSDYISQTYSITIDPKNSINSSNNTENENQSNNSNNNNNNKISTSNEINNNTNSSRNNKNNHSTFSNNKNFNVK
eukprot:jgi/Orpsp1_1/1179520/evm.model.c7180000069679.1